MATELSDAEVFGSPTELSDAQVFAPETAVDTIKRWLGVGQPPAKSSPLADVISSPEAGAADIPQSQAPGPTRQEASQAVAKALAPAPDTTYGNILPLAKDDKTGAIRLALPNMIRSPLIGLTEGPGSAGTFGSSAVTLNPQTGSLGLTPEASSLVPFAATPLGFSGKTPLQFEASGTLERQPIPAGPASNILHPDAAARIQASQGEPVPVAQPIVSTPFNTAPTTVTPGVSAEAAAAATQATPSVTRTGVPVTPPVHPLAPTVAPDGTLVPPQLATPGVAPRTSAEAKQIAGQYYTAADNAGGTLTPQFTNKFIDSVGSVAPQTEAGAAVTGTNAVTGLVDRLQSLRDKPMTLQAAQEVDEGLSNLIDKEYGVTGLSKDGKKLLDIQGTLRDQINNAGSGDTSGGTAGFDALNTARQAWSQAMKMGDLERIQERAALTDNPATSIRTQVRNLITNQSKSRGYTPDEIAALTDAANRGTLGGLLHVFGSRLVPIAAGAAGLSHGPAGMIVGAGLSHVGTGYLRDWATNIQQNRLGNAIGVVGQGVPPPVGPPWL